MAESDDRDYETEITLVVQSDYPRTICCQIGTMWTLLDYPLMPCQKQTLCDTYFDTYCGSLRRSNVSLRIRRTGGRTLLTLKGPREEESSMRVRRLEYEKQWSLHALHSAISKLRTLLSDSIVLNLPHSFGAEICGPEVILSHLGFQVIQRRTTTRKMRSVVVPGQVREQVLAEVSIDRVAFDFGDKSVFHHEVEIEQQLEGNSSLLDEISRGLMCEYAPDLQPWPHSKLRTGLAVRGLMSLDKLDGAIDEKCNLQAQGYAIIRHYLDQDNSSSCGELEVLVE